MIHKCVAGITADGDGVRRRRRVHVQGSDQHVLLVGEGGNGVGVMEDSGEAMTDEGR